MDVQDLSPIHDPLFDYLPLAIFPHNKLIDFSVTSFKSIALENPTSSNQVSVVTSQ